MVPDAHSKNGKSKPEHKLHSCCRANMCLVYHESQEGTKLHQNGSLTLCRLGKVNIVLQILPHSAGSGHLHPTLGLEIVKQSLEQQTVSMNLSTLRSEVRLPDPDSPLLGRGSQGGESGYHASCARNNYDL